MLCLQSQNNALDTRLLAQKIALRDAAKRQLRNRLRNLIESKTPMIWDFMNGKNTETGVTQLQTKWIDSESRVQDEPKLSRA
jgi:hypothetical protein